MKDRISELPDEILISIVSLLTMKEAARTSVLSHRWIDLWKFYDGDLDFDGSSTMVRLARERNIAAAKVDWYISWVDQVVNSHMGLEIEKFKVCYSLEKHHKDVVDRWIKFAMGKKIKKLELNLYSYWCGHGARAYSFPNSLLNPLAFSNFKNLTGVCLASVDITEEGIAYFLANCSLLEQLTVRGAFSLVNLKINSHSLRFLEVTQCHELNSIEICARELHSFKYWGIEVSIGYNDTPSLKDVSLGNFYMEYVLVTLDQHPLFLSQVEMLTLDLTFMIRRRGCFFTRPLPLLCNVRQLELEVLVYHDQCILYLYSLIVASVQLEKLVVKFQFAEWARCEPLFDFRDGDKRKTWRLGNHFHPTLKVVEFVGWHGLEVDTEFAMFIIEHAVLQKVIINPRNQCVFEVMLSSTEKEEEEIEEVARECARQHGKRLPPGVELVII